MSTNKLLTDLLTAAARKKKLTSAQICEVVAEMIANPEKEKIVKLIVDQFPTAPPEELLDKIMHASKGKANPKVVCEILGIIESQGIFVEFCEKV